MDFQLFEMVFSAFFIYYLSLPLDESWEGSFVLFTAGFAGSEHHPHLQSVFAELVPFTNPALVFYWRCNK